MSDTPSPTEIVEAAQAARALGLTEEEMVTTPFKGEDKRGAAIDWVVEKFVHVALVSILFEHENDDGYNVFTVCYNKKPNLQ